MTPALNPSASLSGTMRVGLWAAALLRSESIQEVVTTTLPLFQEFLGCAHLIIWSRPYNATMDVSLLVDIAIVVDFGGLPRERLWAAPSFSFHTSIMKHRTV